MAATHVRSGVVIGTAVAIAAAGAALVLMLDAAREAEPEVTAPAALVDTTTPAITRAPAPVEDDEPTAMDPEGPVFPDERGLQGLPQMGIDSVAFDWAVSPLLTTSDGAAWIHQLLDVDGELWAIGSGYDPARDREEWFVYTSSDGADWLERELPTEVREAGHAQISAFDGGLVAVVQPWDSDSASPQLSVFVTTDRVTWTRSDPSPAVPAGEQVWINHAAGAGDIVVLAGAHAPFMDEPYEPPLVVIEHDGYVIELDEATWSYLVTEAATGDVAAFGSQEHIWSRQEEGGMGIYDPVAGEIIFPIRKEDLDRAARIAYETVAWGDRLLITVTSGARHLTLDEFTGEVTVTDADGAVVFAGSERDMWQGPPPTFRDRDGNPVVTVPWDVWDAAYATAFGEPGTGYQPTPVLLRSADLGASWQAVDITGLVDEDFYFQTLHAGPTGFLAIGSNEPAYEEFASVDAPAPVALRSTDGLVWSADETNLDGQDWLNNVTTVDDGYAAVRGSANGESEVITSATGTVWASDLTQGDLMLEIGRVWFDRLASGALGTFVAGTYDGSAMTAPAPAYIARDGRTLTVESSVFTVTDDATGEMLFAFDERDAMYHEEAVGAPPSGFKWGHGGLVMFDDDGGVIFAMSHRQYEEAMSEVWAEPTGYAMEQVLFHRNGAAWARVPLPEDLGPHSWVSGLVVTDDRVVVTVTQETHMESEYGVEYVVLVGTPAL